MKILLKIFARLFPFFPDFLTHVPLDPSGPLVSHPHTSASSLDFWNLHPIAASDDPPPLQRTPTVPRCPQKNPGTIPPPLVSLLFLLLLSDCIRLDKQRLREKIHMCSYICSSMYVSRGTVQSLRQIGIFVPDDRAGHRTTTTTTMAVDGGGFSMHQRHLTHYCVSKPPLYGPWPTVRI